MSAPDAEKDALVITTVIVTVAIIFTLVLTWLVLG